MRTASHDKTHSTCSDGRETMSNVRQFPPKDARYDRASVWIARLDRGLSENEIRELRAWLSDDAENIAVLTSMARLWDDMDALSRLADLFPVPMHRRRVFLLFNVGIAATLVIAVMLALWVRFGVGPPDEHEYKLVEPAQDVYETSVGEQSTFTLSDGTLVVLNTNSLLRVVFTDEYRLLTLDRGEVNVRVARDASRPLSLIARDKIFQAIGTVFNVEINQDASIELVVTEGRVRVGVRERTDESQGATQPRVLEDSALTVAAGEELVLGENGEEITPVSPEEIEVKLSWRSGDLIFRGEPLEEAVREVGRYTSVEFVVLDQDLKKVRVAGRFKAGDVDGLLVTLRENFNIAYERIDERTVVLGSP